MKDNELLVRQADFQREAATFARELEPMETLGRAGRVLRLGKR